MGTTLGILAGGRGRRYGGRDKGWIHVRGEVQIERLLRVLTPQVEHVIVSANRHLDAYAALGVEAIADRWPHPPDEAPGPLAGIASLFAELRDDALLTVAVDALDIPSDYAARMHAARGDEPLHVVVAEDDDGLQPLFARYPAALGPHAIETFESGRRSVRDWQHLFPVYPCRFAGHRFGNLNSPEDQPAA